MSDAAPARSLSPAVLILGATALSGVSGYLVIGLVAASVDVVDYTTFAVFWSALFLVVGGLGGIQQELARGISPVLESASPVARAARSLPFALAAAVLVAAVLVASSPLWGPPLFGDAVIGVVAALVVGAVGYVLVAASCGVMYGIAAWRALAVMIGLDGALRLALVSVAVAADAPVEVLVWLVALPFVVTVAIVIPIVARRLRRSVLDVPYRRLSANAVRTVVAAAATATIIAGFPVLLRASEPTAPESVIGPLILVLTLTRAPLVIPVMAMQSYLVVRFKENPGTLRRRTTVIAGCVLIAAAVFAVVLGLIGPALFTSVFGAAYALDPLVIAGLVASSGLVAALAVTGPALLARTQHTAVTAGWLVAVGGLIVALLLPLPIVERALLALTIGPTLGLIVHTLALRRPNALASDRAVAPPRGGL